MQELSHSSANKQNGAQWSNSAVQSKQFLEQ